MFHRSKVSSKPLPPGGLYLVTEEKESVHTPNDLASLIGSDGRLRSTSNETFTSSVKTHFESPPLEETTSSPEISPIISCSDSSSVFANKMLDDEVTSYNDCPVGCTYIISLTDAGFF